MPDPKPLDPADAFGQLGRMKLGGAGLDGILEQIADLARRTIPGAQEVSVTLVGDGNAHTAACTGELALTLDEWQYGDRHGPCLDAAASRATLSVPDLATEDRWPNWTGRALHAGAGSSLSIGLPVHEKVTGALNIYAAEPHAFDSDAIVLGQTFAGYAVVAMADAHLYDAQASLAQHMQAAMESRAVIEQAKGILMANRRCTANEAFAILTNVSRETNRKLRDVATALVTTASPDRTKAADGT